MLKLKIAKLKMYRCWVSSSLFAILFIFSMPSWAQVKIVALGDSLTEGYGIAEDKAYPNLLQERFKNEGTDIKIVNAGVSGSTSASALSRLKWHLKMKPDILILALGANDGLRGLSPEKTRKNLLSTIELAKQNSIKILFIGMKMPPNYGQKYQKDYEKLFKEIATKEKIEFIPFMLEGVAGNPKLNLSDGIHPNEEGHKVVAETIYNSLKKLL